MRILFIDPSVSLKQEMTEMISTGAYYSVVKYDYVGFTEFMVHPEMATFHRMNSICKHLTRPLKRMNTKYIK